VASIHPRPSGSYKVAFRLEGRQRSITVASLDDAVKVVDLIDRFGPADALRLVDAHASTPASVPTVAEHLRDYVARLDGITDGTRKDYLAQVENRVAGTPLGDLPITLVTRDAVAAWLRDLPGATKTKRNYHALVSAGLAAAAEADLIPSNPAKGIRIRQAEPVHDMVILTPGELAVLVAEIDPRFQPLVITLAGTGLRWGEATALRVGDVDLDARVPVAHVTKAWKRTGSGRMELGPPKTRAGVRTVSLPPEVVGVIRPLVEGRRQDAWLFSGVQGNPVRGNNFHDLVWGPALDRLNADRDEEGNLVTPRLTKRPRAHDLRHFHASQLVAAGVPLNVVQRRLGHESIKTTVDRYSHLAPDHLEVSAAAASLGLVQAVPAIES
jgi:integrase